MADCDHEVVKANRATYERKTLAAPTAINTSLLWCICPQAVTVFVSTCFHLGGLTGRQAVGFCLHVQTPPGAKYLNSKTCPKSMFLS